MSDDEVQAGGCMAGIVVLGMVIFGGIHYSVKYCNRNDAVKVTKTEITTPQATQVWHVQDKRGLFNWNEDFIVAKNAADSAYADKNLMGLGEFEAEGQLKVYNHRSKGKGWHDDPDIMNYELK